MRRNITLCWQLVLCLLVLAGGCKKKADQQGTVEEGRTASEVKVIEEKVIGEEGAKENELTSDVKVNENRPQVTVNENKTVNDVKAEEHKPVLEIKVDENKPISQIKAEVEQMDVRQLKETALKYKEALEARRVDIEETVARAKPAGGEMTEEESKALIADIGRVTRSVQALDERFKIYYNRLKELGADTSEFEKK